MKQAKMRHCFNCGAEIGVYIDYDNLDTCGEPECNRAARDAESQACSDAHDHDGVHVLSLFPR